MNKPKKMAISKEQEIITVAARLFKEKGYRATTLEDIAAAVGMLKGSLYYYIQSKEELLYIVVREPVRQIYSKLEEIVNSDARIKANVRIYVSGGVGGRGNWQNRGFCTGTRQQQRRERSSPVDSRAQTAAESSPADYR